MIVGILVPIALFASIFGIVYIAITARNKERMAMIEKGQDSSIFKLINETHQRYGALKFGILAIGIGIGLIVANILDVQNIMDDEVVYFAMIALFGGFSLVVYYLIMRKIKPEKEE